MLVGGSIAQRLRRTAWYIGSDATNAAPAHVRTRVGAFFGVVAAVIWGCYVAFLGRGMDLGLAPADLAFLRYATACLVLLPWLLMNSPLTLGGIGWGRGTVLALLAGPAYVLVGASGFLFAPLAHSAVIQLGAVSVLGALFGVLLLRERPTRQNVVGMAVVVIGLAVTSGPGLLEGSSGAWKGDALFVVAGGMWALFTVLQRRWAVSPVAGTAAVSVLSGAIFAPAFIFWRGLDALLAVEVSVLLQQVVMLGFLSGVVALFAFARAVEYLGPTRAALFPAMAPAVAIAAGIPVAGQIPDGWNVAGLLILSAGMAISMYSPDAECFCSTRTGNGRPNRGGQQDGLSRP